MNVNDEVTYHIYEANGAYALSGVFSTYKEAEAERIRIEKKENRQYEVFKTVWTSVYDEDGRLFSRSTVITREERR